MKVRFAVIGTGKISDTILAAGGLDSRFVPYAVYSRRAESGEAFAKKHGMQVVYTSLEEMLADSNIDAVYIASPNSCHCHHTVAALRAGKHVLVEKAFASNTREAKQMVEAARESGKVLMEAIKTIPTPNFQAAKAALGRIGKVRRYFSSYCQYSSRYDAFRRGEVLNAFKPELSNGALVDIGVYTIYPMVALFGMPKGFSASAQMLSSGVDGQGTVTFHYDGMDGVVLYSKIADSELVTEIQGEDGTITLNRINTIDRVTFTPRGGESEELTCDHCGDDYYYEIAEFLDTIERGACESSINTHERSLEVVSLLEAVRKECGILYPTDNQ